MEDRYVNDVEAAKMLSASPQTLRNWRCMGRGPSYTKRGKMVRYQIKNLLSYMEEGRIDPEARQEAGNGK